MSYCQRRPFLEQNGDLGGKNGFKSSFWLEDVSDFAVVRAKRGRKRIVFPGEMKPLHPPVEDVRQPKIKVLLMRAFEWQARLEANPGLTQTVLSKETGVSRVRVTQILNLRRLAPEIQKHILAMPPITTKRGVITENQLRGLIGIQDHRLQVRKFRNLSGLSATTEAVA